MALRIVATRPYPDLLTLPWHLPLEDWGPELLVALPQGISRHVVRLVRRGADVYAVKETRPRMAFREYRTLRDLQRLGLPVVEPVGVVEGRTTEGGDVLEPALVTRHLRFSLPYRSVFAHGLRAESLPRVIDALAVLLVRLHLAGLFWGDVSLSNVLFRRSAGEFAAYLVDAETGELHPQLSEGQREQDLELAETNLYGELLDLQAGRLLDEGVDPLATVHRVRDRYDALWDELRAPRSSAPTRCGGSSNASSGSTTWASTWTARHRQRLAGRHRARTAQGGRGRAPLTRAAVADRPRRRGQPGPPSAQRPRLVSATSHGIDADDRGVVAHRWLTEVYEPVTGLVPQHLRGRLEPAEVFHEMLEHRWFLSERAGREVDIFDATQAYVEEVLAEHPEEAIAATDPAAR